LANLTADFSNVLPHAQHVSLLYYVDNFVRLKL